MTEEQRAILTITQTLEQGWVLAFQGAYWEIDAMSAIPGAQQVRYDLMRLPDGYVLQPMPPGDPWTELNTAVKPTRPLPPIQQSESVNPPSLRLPTDGGMIGK